MKAASGRKQPAHSVQREGVSSRARSVLGDLSPVQPEGLTDATFELLAQRDLVRLLYGGGPASPRQTGGRNDQGKEDVR